MAESKQEHIDKFITATGRSVIVVKVSPSSPFFRLKYDDNSKTSGTFPEKYSGVYTSPREADLARKEFVLETWEVAEENMPKRKRA